MYSGIYFTNDGKAYVVGIIDSLTVYNAKKKGENVWKNSVVYRSTTPEGYPGSSCVHP